MTTPYQQAPTPRIQFGWIGEAWKLVTSQMGVWIGAVLVTFIIIGVVSAISSGILSFATGGYVGTAPAFPPSVKTFGMQSLSSIPSYFVSAFLSAGLYRMALAQVRSGGTVDFSILFSGASVYWKMLAYVVIPGVAVLALEGVFFVCLPELLHNIPLLIGIVVLFVLVVLAVSALIFPGYAIIADGAPLPVALRESFRVMLPNLLPAIAFLIVLGLAVAAGAILCIIGIVVTAPLTYVVSALMYRDMIGMPALGVGREVEAQYPPQTGAWPPPPSWTSAGQPPSPGQSPLAGPPPAPQWPAAGPSQSPSNETPTTNAPDDVQ